MLNQWSEFVRNTKPTGREDSVKVVAEHIDSNYQAYLDQLQQNNEHRAFIRRKSNASIRRERLERGFKLYFNLPEPLTHRKERFRGPLTTTLEKQRESENASLATQNAQPHRKRIASAPVLQKCRQVRRKAWGGIEEPQISSSLAQLSGQLRCTSADASSCLNSTEVSNPELRVIVQLDILENWGNPNAVSIGEIELFSSNQENQLIALDEVQCNLLCGGTLLGPEVFTPNQVQKCYSITDPTRALIDWTTHASYLPVRLNIKYRPLPYIAKSLVVNLRITNPSAGDETNAGIKRCRVGVHLFSKFHGPSQLITMEPAQVKTLRFEFECESNLVILAKKISRSSSDLLDNTVHENEVNRTKLEIHADKKEEKTRRTNFLDQLSNELIIRTHSPDLVNQHSKQDEVCCSSLEESWTSIDFFNHCHAGRLPSTRVETKRDSITSGESDHRETHRDAERGTPDGCATEFSKTEATMFIKCPPRPCDHAVCIPELPQGHTLLFDIVSTWGDSHYVGLTGVEIYNSEGVDIAPNCSLSAEPSDINILPAYGKDPRVVKNLVDGVHWTRDDIHMWLTPFTKGERHLIQFDLPEGPVTLAMIRVWNYNKSRVHTSRGVRELIIYLDDEAIFHGEICRASGQESGEPEEFSETILFTTDDGILELVAVNDSCLHRSSWNMTSQEFLFDDPLDSERPTTVISTIRSRCEEEKDLLCSRQCELENERDESIEKLCSSALYISRKAIESVHLTLVDTWAEKSTHIGLTGFEILDEQSNIIPIRQITLYIKNQRIDSLTSPLLNGYNETLDVDNMWSCPFDLLDPPKLHLQFQRPHNLDAIRIWNYNDRRSGCEYGVKWIRISDDQGKILVASPESDCFLLRRAPGHTDFPFAQTVKFAESNVQTSISTSCTLGFIYQIQIFTSWYDRYYVGLNGLELIDSDGSVVPTTQFSLYAYPASINQLITSSQLSPDIRTVEKLVDGVNCGPDIGHHCWLVPLLPNTVPRIFIVFNQPVAICGLRMWNYTRTPERGVREFAVLIDDQMVYRGYLPKSENNLQSELCMTSVNTLPPRNTASGILPNCDVLCKSYKPFKCFIVPLDREILEGFEFDPKSMLDEEQFSLGDNTYVGDFPPKMMNIEKRTYKNNPSLRMNISVNQSLRPFTCVSRRQR